MIGRPAILGLLAAMAWLGAGAELRGPSTHPAPPSSVAGIKRCVVRLHGKGGDGAATTVDDLGVTQISPAGNGEGWGGRQWLYFPDEEYARARDIVESAAEGCDAVIISGFSNGGAFAAALLCHGETLGGRLLRVVIDDPVPDTAVVGCTADPGVGVTLYWTGALDATAQPGWNCGEADWTCQDETTIGIEAYAEALGVMTTPSAHAEHEWFVDAPELNDWTVPNPATGVAPPTSSSA